MQRQKLGGRAYDAKEKSPASSITGKTLANDFITSLSILTYLLQSLIFFN